MGKQLITLLFACLLALPLSTAGFTPQDTMGKEKAAKAGRWEGVVARSNPDKSTITVRRSENRYG